MKYILWLVGIVLGLALIIGGLQIVASERVEVVPLHTINAADEEVVTRLWVVDYDGHAHLRRDTDSVCFIRPHPSARSPLIRAD